MSLCSKTSIVFNENSKLVGLQPFYYRWRVCNTNLTGNTPADQYQKLKLIQNTVRVHSSLYVSNLGSLSAYKQPINNPNAGFYGVCWNQMSDRPVPSVQRASIPTGYNNSLNRRHTSVTSSKPGSQTPGGIGCDIKHNSYDRYLNRLKGKGPLKRGVVLPTFGTYVPFNPAFPVYGSKTTKTSIVSGCPTVADCTTSAQAQNAQIYNNPISYPEPSGNCAFQVGDYVYAVRLGTDYDSRAVITDITDGVYTIVFGNGDTQQAVLSELKIYFPCNCNELINQTNSVILNALSYSDECIVPVNSLKSFPVL